MAMRLLSALIQQDGVASAGGAASHFVALQAAADAAARGDVELATLDVEQSLRRELTSLGLMEAVDIEYDQPSLREDDQICVELRHQQDALRRKIAEMEDAQSSSRKALLQKVEQGFTGEKVLADVIAAAKGLEGCLLPKFKLAKGVKPQDVKRQQEIWDKALHRWRSYNLNPNRRKPLGSAVVAKTEVPKPAVAKGGGGGGGGGKGWAGGASTQGLKVAEFHASIHRKHH